MVSPMPQIGNPSARPHRGAATGHHPGRHASPAKSSGRRAGQARPSRQEGGSRDDRLHRPFLSSYEPGSVQSYRESDQPGYDQPGYDQPGYDQPQGSTTAVAQEQAAAVGQSAAEAGSRVTQTATDQAREVVSETARQARDLLGEAGGQVRDQTSVQQQKAASQLRSVADELHEMVAKGGQSGVATEVAQQAAERLHGAASWLEQREPADVLQAVRDFARRRPGVFLAGAVAAGLAAGRLTRGMTDAARSGGQHQGSRRLPPREIPPGAAIPPPPDPDWTTPMPEYPADAVPGVTTGTVTPGAARPSRTTPRPESPALAPPGTTDGGSYRADFQDSDYPDSPPETYRPGQQP